jgi:GTPase
MPYKAGYVSILGNPNVGKSTLMNALTGERLSIITSKSQTTRHRILGIVNEEDCQIIFSDTPGIIKPHYLLQSAMMKCVAESLEDADLILYIIAVGDQPQPNEMIENVNRSRIPVLLVINKIDRGQPSDVDQTENAWKLVFDNAEIIRVSALRQWNTDTLFKKIVEKIPENPPYFSADELTDRPMRFFVSEIIREKILLNYDKEVPYCCEVSVTSYKEDKDITRIAATIHVARESQKAILLGHKGSAIKKTGTMARKDIEAFVGSQVYLDLTVKVSKDWRENDNQLKKFGYDL